MNGGIHDYAILGVSVDIAFVHKIFHERMDVPVREDCAHIVIAFLAEMLHGELQNTTVWHRLCYETEHALGTPVRKGNILVDYSVYIVVDTCVSYDIFAAFYPLQHLLSFQALFDTMVKGKA